MKRAAIALSLVTAACQRPSQASGNDSAGARLEQAAVAAGLVADPASRSIIGAWSRDTDRACIVPGGSERDSRIGVLIDYGLGQGCVASGVARRSGDMLDVRLGECRLTVRFDGTRLVFPPDVPVACDQLCTGRASLAAMTVERQSASVSEARSLRAPSGRSLCAS